MPAPVIEHFLNAIKARPVGGKNSQRKLVSLLFKRGEKSRFSAQTKRRFLFVATNGAVDRMNFLNASALPQVWDALAPFLARIPGAFEALLAGDVDRIGAVRDVLDVAIKAVVRMESVSKVDPSIMDDAISKMCVVGYAPTAPTAATVPVPMPMPMTMPMPASAAPVVAPTVPDVGLSAGSLDTMSIAPSVSRGRAEAAATAATAAAAAAAITASRAHAEWLAVLPPQMSVKRSPRSSARRELTFVETVTPISVPVVAPVPVKHTAADDDNTTRPSSPSPTEVGSFFEQTQTPSSTPTPLRSDDKLYSRGRRESTESHATTELQLEDFPLESFADEFFGDEDMCDLALQEVLGDVDHILDA